MRYSIVLLVLCSLWASALAQVRNSTTKCLLAGFLCYVICTDRSFADSVQLLGLFTWRILHTVPSPNPSIHLLPHTQMSVHEMEARAMPMMHLSIPVFWIAMATVRVFMTLLVRP